MKFPPIRISSRLLAGHGIDTATATRLGGIVSPGGNITFVEDTEGFGRVVALKGVKPPRPIKERESVEALMKRIGPPIWAMIFRWALRAELANPTAFLSRVTRSLPCGKCRRHWTAMLTRTPPAFATVAERFAWAWARKNEVNVELGQSTLTLTEALDEWSAKV